LSDDGEIRLKLTPWRRIWPGGGAFRAPRARATGSPSCWNRPTPSVARAQHGFDARTAAHGQSL